MDERVTDISKYLRFLVHRIGCSDLLPVLNVGSYPEIFCLHEHNWMNSRDFLLFCCCLHLVPVCWLIAVPLCSFGIIQMIISQPIEKMNTEVSTLISIYTSQACLLLLYTSQ